MWFRRKSKPDPAKAAAGLRNQALTVDVAQLGEPAGGLSTRAVLMEIGYPNGVATLAVFADGTTSLYFSSGGGIIGAGAHPPVEAAARVLLAAAERFRSSCSVVTATPYPEPGRVRFYIRTVDGTLGAEAAEQELGSNRHPLSSLFHAGHKVLTAVRLTSGDR
jgi:hypothetical protein